MPMDGLTLSFIRDELDATLTGGRVDKITQPERDEIIIALRSLGKNRSLLISINPNCARIHLTGDRRVSPLEPSNFCMLMRKHLQGGRFAAVRQIGGDRILEIDIENRDELGDLTQFAAVVEINNNTGTVMSNIAANKNGNTIGYISMGSLDDTVKAVTFEGVEPTAENVKNGSYTLSRPFNIVYKSEDSLSAAAKEFIDFIMSPAGQWIAQYEGYISETL